MRHLWKGKTRDPNRIKPMLELIEKIWTKYPDLRLCQLIENCIPPKGATHCIYYVEDDILKEKLEEMYGEIINE